MGESHDPDGIGFSDGDPDYQAKVIPGTLMPVPWAQRPLAQVMVTLIDDDGEPYYYEPRNVLRRVGQRLYDLGLTRSEEHTSELQSLMRISYAVFCLTQTNRPSLSSRKCHRDKHIYFIPI